MSASAGDASAATGWITRTGKIARLPQAIRQRLNERLADGEPQLLLVAWLNEHDVVRERLERFVTDGSSPSNLREYLLERATNSVALALVQLMREAMAGDPIPEEL